MSYVLLQTGDEVKDAVDDLMTRKIVGLDFETTGLDPRSDTPLLLGIDEYIIPCWRYWPDDSWAYAVKPLVESKDIVKVEYNAVFEGMFFEAAGIRQRRVLDPMIGDQLLYVGLSTPKGFFSLGQALQRYLYVSHDKTLQTSFVGADPATFVPTTEQLEYLYRDVEYMAALADAVGKRVAEQGLMGTWKLENQYTQALAQMQYHGALVDTEGYRLELAKVNEEFDTLERSVSETLSPPIMEVRRRRYQAAKTLEDAWKAERDAQKLTLENWQTSLIGQARRDWINEQLKLWKAAHPAPPTAKMNHGAIMVTSPKQIHEALVELGIRVEDTEKDTLIMARANVSPEHVELLKELGELSQVKKILSNEGDVLLNERLYDGNRLTTRYGQLRARTGRISSNKWRDKGVCNACGYEVEGELDAERYACPSCGRECATKNFGKEWGANAQNLTARFKRYVKPGPGRKFIIYDYSQIELRVMAELILRENPAATDALVKAFRDGLDPHSLTGEDVTGMPYAEFYRRAVADKEPDMVRLRRGMKVVNFGAGFGFAAPAMAVKIYVDVGDTTPFGPSHIAAAQKRLDAFWRTNPTLGIIRDKIGQQAMNDGYTETLGGRRRYYETRGLARYQIASIKRQAVSTVIQGSAADVAKEAQNLIYTTIADSDPAAWLWSVTHDEIAMECEAEMADAWNETMPVLMTRAFEKYITHVPCELDGGIQTSWAH